ncbi:MAG: M18 family aminopeptidase [Bacilli bacterium]|nr:M18 family aminopeptidase [Bacilli bacterium]
MAILKEFKQFIDHAHVNFFAIQEAEKMLIDAGYTRVFEENIDENIPNKIYFKRMDLSLIALNLGEDAKENNYPFNIIASHVDSPCFKVKPHLESSNSNYHKIDVEPYGGMIASSWFDRLLSIAGRVTYKKDSQIASSLIDFDEDLCLIPNVAIHLNREINEGYKYNFATDTQPFTFEMKESLLSKIANKLNIKEEDILSHDLYLYNRDQLKEWGEFITSPRLDDLECVFTSLKAFLEINNKKVINVLYLANNEEVGSSSSTGADSDYLESILTLLSKKLDFSLEASLANSFLVSADNAHAVHPNHGELSDPVDAPKMNQGIVIKYSASNRYTSDGLSSSIFMELLKRSGISYQIYTNRSDIRGGSTLGNILLSHVSLLSVDVGLAQLAMHSANETAGKKDIENAIESFKAFYQSHIKKDKDNYVIE